MIYLYIYICVKHDDDAAMWEVIHLGHVHLGLVLRKKSQICGCRLHISPLFLVPKNWRESSKKWLSLCWQNVLVLDSTYVNYYKSESFVFLVYVFISYFWCKLIKKIMLQHCHVINFMKLVIPLHSISWKN